MKKGGGEKRRGKKEGKKEEGEEKKEKQKKKKKGEKKASEPRTSRGRSPQAGITHGCFVRSANKSHCQKKCAQTFPLQNGTVFP